MGNFAYDRSCYVTMQRISNSTCCVVRTSARRAKGRSFQHIGQRIFIINHIDFMCSDRSRYVPQSGECVIKIPTTLPPTLCPGMLATHFGNAAQIFHASNDSEFCNNFLRVHRYAKERDFLHAKESV